MNYQHNGSGVPVNEPRPEDFDDHEDFMYAWQEWKAEYGQRQQTTWKIGEE